MGKPKVSVCMLAYNNAEYIEQAIDSVFAQQVDFEIELVIGEDASTDNVIEKINKYRDSKNVRLLISQNPENMGVVKNFAQTLSLCTGEYIALLDNDDYWCTNDKLQKQVDFLDSNNSFVICYHPTSLLIENEIGLDTIRDVPVISGIDELARGNFIRSCALMLRRSAFHGLPAEYFNQEAYDYFLLMLVAKNGQIGRLGETMAVYRIHNQNDWFSRADQEIHILKYLECMIGFFEPTTNQILIERHQKIAFKLLLKNIKGAGFSSYMQRCLKYGDTYVQANLVAELRSESSYVQLIQEGVTRFLNDVSTSFKRMFS